MRNVKHESHDEVVSGAAGGLTLVACDYYHWLDMSKALYSVGRGVLTLIRLTRQF